MPRKIGGFVAGLRVLFASMLNDAMGAQADLAEKDGRVLVREYSAVP